jgi:hypothetical protein
MGQLALPLFIAGTGMQAYSKYQEGQAAAQEAKNAAVMEEYNAQVAEQAAKAAENRSMYEQERQLLEAKRVKGAQAAAIAGAGGIPGAGSNLLLQAKQASELELDNLMIGYEGLTEAQRARSQAAGYRLQGSIYKQKAKNLKQAGLIGAGTSLLTGFSSYKDLYGSAGSGGLTQEGKAILYGGRY